MFSAANTTGMSYAGTAVPRIRLRIVEYDYGYIWWPLILSPILHQPILRAGRVLGSDSK